MLKFLLSAALVLTSSVAVIAGDADYTPEEIVKFFNDQAANRGICVGTEEECGIAVDKPSGFNLRVNFEYNSAILTADAKANLVAFAQAISSPSLSVARFAVEGYTDATGSDSYNQELSERRAEAVVSYLKSLGVDALRLHPKGFGESAPIGKDQFDPLNRRVETRLVR